LIGIYKITNIINGKSYIGQSTNIHRRWQAEIADSNNINCHSYDYPLMRAFRKYGIDNFKFEIIEECRSEELNQKETYWIDYFDTFFHGYNQTLGGDTTIRQPKENVIGVISDLTNTNMTHKDIAIKWGMSTEMVQGINTGRYWKHNANYPLQKRQMAKISYCEKCGKEITKGSKLCISCYEFSIAENSNKPSKDDLIRDLYGYNGNFTKVGQIYNVSSNSVKKWCKKYGIPNKSSDYRTKTDKKTKEKIRPFKMGVVQLDMETSNEIKTFNSISEAAESLGLNNKCCTHISDVCKGKRITAYGYKWKFL
jgi:group I intron endonuclease